VSSASIEHGIGKPWAVAQGFLIDETWLSLVRQDFIAVCKKMH